eukprot:420882_1
MSNSQYHIVAVFATVLSATSILGSSWIIRAACNRRRRDMRYRIEEYRRNYIVSDYVLYMSICDVCVHVMTLLYYSAVAAQSSWIQNVGENLFPICWIFGFIYQFSLISSATWSFAIALNLWWLMQGAEIDELIPEEWNIFYGIKVKKHKVIITYFALLCSCIAFGDYGLTPNQDDIVGGKYECWMKHTGYQMTLYGPVSIYILVAFGIFCKIILSKCQCLKSGNSIQNKLVLYTALFSFVWVWPCINRYWGFSKTSSPHWGIVAMHHILLSSIGLGNFFIWTCGFSKPASL